MFFSYNMNTRLIEGRKTWTDITNSLDKLSALDRWLETFEVGNGVKPMSVVQGL